MRLTLDLDNDMHRKIKTLAAFHGQTIKAYILSRIGLDDSTPAPVGKLDETDYLFSTPANAAHLEKSLAGQSQTRVKFDTIEDVKRALGI